MKLKQVQQMVWSWCRETFEGIAAWETTQERAYRFLEEAVELFQAVGMTELDAIKIVDYVYKRPVGEISQEIGGTMITLLALASQQDQCVESSMLAEYNRITQPEVQQKIRAKQLAKNQAFL